MNINEFADKVKKYVIEAGYEAQIQVVNKSNAVLTGVCIKRPGSNIGPNVYMEQFFGRFNNGENFEDLAKKILEVAEANMKQSVDTTLFTNWDKAAKNVRPKLVPRKENESYLKDKVWTPFLDLAIVYRIEIPEMNADGGIAGVVVTQELLDKLGISPEELDKVARENISDDIIFISMVEMFAGQLPRDAVEMMIAQNPMRILTNSEKINGAVQLLNPAAIEKVKVVIGNRFYIIPSSIHEVIILPPAMVPDESCLKDLITNVNAEELDPEDILSDHAYLYADGEFQSVA